MPVVRVYCPRASDGARDLVAALKRQNVPNLRPYRVREAQPMPFWRGVFVNWGSSLIDMTDVKVKVLNQAPLRNKLRELEQLRDADVPVPPFTRSPGVAGWDPAVTILGRDEHHQEARDLLNPPTAPDYFTRKLPIIREFRMHVFNGKSVRAGMKSPRPGFANPHPWIRSSNSGWDINYDAEAQKHVAQRHRDLAKKAVAALGYDFGAVDLGLVEGPDRPRSLVVLEVNSAPGLSNPNTADAYARHIVEWLK